MHAQDGRLRIGGIAGMAYSQNFYKIWHSNFICNDGYRVDDSGQERHFHASGSFLAGVTFETGRKTVLSLQSGYAGISDRSRIVPVLLGITRFNGSASSDSAFWYASAGAGFHIEGMQRYGIAALTALGGGYRFCLCPELSMDLKMGLNASYDRPPVKDIDGIGYVPRRNIRRSNSVCCALEIGVSFSF